METVIAEAGARPWRLWRKWRKRARQYGYQDGINDGSRDRRTGHSNRPTQDSNYKHADHGYSSSYGDKNYYKQSYRQAYETRIPAGLHQWRRLAPVLTVNK